MVFLKTFKLSMESDNPVLYTEACEAVTQLSQAVGSTFCVISLHIVQILNHVSNVSKQLQFTILLTINENVGISSNVFKKFNNYSHQLIDILNNEDTKNQVF